MAESKEVELKVELSKQDFLSLKKRLLKIAHLAGEVEMEDYYLDHPQASFINICSKGFKSAEQYLRIRKSSQGHALCFKKVIRDGEGKNPYCKEYEVSIDQPETTLQLFYQMGYKDSAVIKKRRTLFWYFDYEIALDEVMNLGLFVEIEFKKEVGDPAKGLRELENFLRETLGVAAYIPRTQGYVSMLWNCDAAADR